MDPQSRFKIRCYAPGLDFVIRWNYRWRGKNSRWFFNFFNASLIQSDEPTDEVAEIADDLEGRL